MLNRILLSSIAAATLLTAAPALAEDKPSSEPCSCCSDGSRHDVDHRVREERKNAERAAQQRAAEEDPYIRNQSFGG